MSSEINSIIIVGGGTSGWLCAAYLARRLGTHQKNGVKITLIEASDIPTVGVGEGTFPSLRTTMATIGVDEADFMRESSCTFKQGIKFVDWEFAPENGHHQHYYHLFNFPRLMGGGIDLSPYWLMGAANKGLSFADAVTLQEEVCEASLAPKRITDKPYSSPMNHAYHFDAGRFAQFLKKTAISFGVKHVVGKVDSVNLAEDGSIASLDVGNQGIFDAGLYIDCSGFFGVMISKALAAPRRDLSDILFVDRALAIQVPYKNDKGPIASTTISAAQEAGWIWDIGLDKRRGIGYVFSSRHTDEGRAEEVIRKYIGADAYDLETRHIRMPTGYCETPWKKNCVAVGLAGGFLEPLEATGIAMTEAAIRLIADYFPRDGDTESVSRLFNRAMNERYENAVEFIKMHYYLTKRTDTDFWRDNGRDENVPDSLLEKLHLWRTRTPAVTDFASVHNMFKRDSYQYVLFGMGFRPDLSGKESEFPYLNEAKVEFQHIRAAAKRAGEAMPDHRSLLAMVYNNGFSQESSASHRG